MRLVHLSDIHLSKDNYTEFQNNYKDALLKDLAIYHNSIPIDLIIITGDLVDKGGHSLFEISEFKDYKSPYDIFEKVFINPISEQLGIDKHKFLFIPGNHDIDEKEILLVDEKELVNNINNKNINDYLLENKSFKHSNRIRKFKEFEEKYHSENSNYSYTSNQSTYVYEYKNSCKIGFILVNDSWRCKSIKLSIEEDEKHYFGVKQLYDGLEYLNQSNTQLNICLLHHTLDDYKESLEVEGILNRKNIELFLYGHFHNTKTNILYTPNGNCKGFRARAAFFKPEEINSDYHSGYQILDFDLTSNYKITAVHYRKYNNKEDSKSFISDNETAPMNGIDKNNSNSNMGFELSREGRENKKQNLNKDLFK